MAMLLCRAKHAVGRVELVSMLTFTIVHHVLHVSARLRHAIVDVDADFAILLQEILREVHRVSQGCVQLTYVDGQDSVI